MRNNNQWHRMNSTMTVMDNMCTQEDLLVNADHWPELSRYHVLQPSSCTRSHIKPRLAPSASPRWLAGVLHKYRTLGNTTSWCPGVCHLIVDAYSEASYKWNAFAQSTTMWLVPHALSFQQKPRSFVTYFGGFWSRHHPDLSCWQNVSYRLGKKLRAGSGTIKFKHVTT